jgi:uncharacterized protein (DUF1499 family)
LAEAIYVVEDDREVKYGPNDSAVVQMRAARNMCYDDLGWNEQHGCVC